MSRHATALQLIGPATVFAALLAAESAAYALALYPSSQLLWSVNLQLFGVFQKGHYVLSTYVDMAYFQIACIGLPLLLVACYGLVLKRPLALAVASSLSFIYVAFLLGAAYAWDEAWRHAPFVVARILSGPGACVTAVLVGASLLSLVVSHMSYLRACRANGHGLQSLCLRDGPGRDRRHFVLRGAQ
jgi:hypothetical protein